MKNKYLYLALRIATGLVLTTAGVLLIMRLGDTQIAAVTREVPEITVDTKRSAGQTLVCPGSFAILGANTSDPEAAVPVGEATITKTSEAETGELAGAQAAAPAPTPAQWFKVAGSAPFAAISTQKLNTETVIGSTAIACQAPANDQWITAGSTMRGVTGTIILSNPGSVAAQVTVTVFDEGESELKIASRDSAGLLVPAGTQRIVSLNGFGSSRQSPVVRIESTGAPVTATMGVTEIQDLAPIGADLVGSQTEPRRELLFIGAVNYVDHTHTLDHEAEEHDDFPAMLRLFAPTAEGPVTATITGLTAKGEELPLGEVQLQNGEVADTLISSLPTEVKAVQVVASEPVVGGLRSSVHSGNDHDFTWVAPAASFKAGQRVPVVAPAGAELIVVNTEDRETLVQLADGSEVTLAPLATHTLKAEQAGGAAGIHNQSITADGQIAVGGVLFNESSIATFSVLVPGESLGELTIFPR